MLTELPADCDGLGPLPSKRRHQATPISGCWAAYCVGFLQDSHVGSHGHECLFHRRLVRYTIAHSISSSTRLAKGLMSQGVKRFCCDYRLGQLGFPETIRVAPQVQEALS